MRLLGLILFGAAITALAYAGTPSERWPPIATLQKAFDFPDASKAAATLLINGKDTHHPLYRLDCRTWRYEDDPTFMYSGDFECRLIPMYGTRRYTTLFIEEAAASREWQTRARFLASELQDGCADLAEYGAVRTFRLRGMRIKLALSNIRLEENAPSEAQSAGPMKLRSFRFSVDVTPDATAHSAITEPPDVAPRPDRCGRGYVSPRR